MRLVLLPLAIAAIMVLPAPALACMKDPLPEAVVFDSPPAHRPPGYSAFKVLGRLADLDRDRLLVGILEPARARRLGQYAWLRFAPMTSCTGWGRLDRQGYVVAKVAGRLRGKTLLTARPYRRSRWDWLWRLFGLTRFTAAGEAIVQDR